MRSYSYAPAPKEHIPDIDHITLEYVMWCDEYAAAYIMCQFLSKLRYCDFSPPTDDFYFKDGVIHSNWVVFYSCRPVDADRLRYIANRVAATKSFNINMEGYV